MRTPPLATAASFRASFGYSVVRKPHQVRAEYTSACVRYALSELTGLLALDHNQTDVIRRIAKRQQVVANHLVDRLRRQMFHPPDGVFETTGEVIIVGNAMVPEAVR